MRPIEVGCAVPPARSHDALLVDLDGVVYVGPDPVAHAVSALTRAGELGARPAYVTNNASRPPEAVADHLRRLGLDVTADDVVTSSQAGARMVASLVPPGSPVLAVGGPGVALALVERGLRPVSSASDGPAAVLQGFGQDVSWRELAQACHAIEAGAHHVATNLDATLPTPEGRAPGNGALVGLVSAVTGVIPPSAGKPESPLLIESVERLGATRPLVLGDRLDTDIEAACRLGLPSLLVLTGVTGARQLLGAAAHQRPSLLSADLRGLHEAHPPVAAEEAAATCRQSRVEADGGRLVVKQRGDDLVDLLRAAAVLAWRWADGGRPLDPAPVLEASGAP